MAIRIMQLVFKELGQEPQIVHGIDFPKDTNQIVMDPYDEKLVINPLVKPAGTTHLIYEYKIYRDSGFYTLDLYNNIHKQNLHTNEEKIMLFCLNVGDPNIGKFNSIYYADGKCIRGSHDWIIYLLSPGDEITFTFYDNPTAYTYNVFSREIHSFPNQIHLARTSYLPV